MSLPIARIAPPLLSLLLITACASSGTAPGQTASASSAPAAESRDGGFDEEEVLVEAQRVFGEGAEGLAKLVEDIFRERGRPNAYIVGNEGSGAVGVGLRYGAGKLYHAVEGERDVYWTARPPPWG